MAEDKIDELIKQLASRNDNVRWSAAEALVKIGKPVVPALIDALNDENDHVRYHSVNALGKIGDVHAVPYLIDALKDKYGWARVAADDGLVRIIPSLTDFHLRETGELLRKAVEKAEGRVEKKKLFDLIEKVNKRKNEILAPEAKKLKPPKISKRRKKPPKGMWRMRQTTC